MGAVKPMFTEREAREFSLHRWLDHQAQGANGNSLERELLEEFARVRGEPFIPHEAVIPWELLGRALTAAGTGSQFITETVSPALQALRAGGSLVARLGIPMIDAPPGDHRVPLMPPATDAQWWDADGVSDITAEQPTIGAGRIRPRTMASLASYSKAWERESISGPDALGAWLIDMVARTLDRAMLTGAGGIEPLGLAGMADRDAPLVQTGAVDGTDTFGDLVAIEHLIEAAEGRNTAWVASPASKALLRSRALGDGSPIWTADTIDGVAAVSTPICPDGQLFAGDWSSVQVYLWGGGPRIATKHNGASLFAQGLVQMRILVECDVIALRPERLAVAAIT